MKKYLAIIGLALLMTSCLKDETVYEFAEHEEITVTGIEDRYTVVSNVDHITLSPTVSSTDPNAEFEYMWGIYETNVQGSAPVLDTLAWTQDIDQLVRRAAKDWVLVYRVTNTNTGYSKYVNTTISVVTLYTRGWYVAKTESGQTDLDLFLTPESIMPDDKIDNVFSAVNGRKLNGHAGLLTFFSSYKSNVVNPAQFGNTRSLFVVTDQDVSVVNINDLKEIRDFNSVYFQPPAVKQPKFVFIGPQAYYFNNGGKLSSIYNMSSNTGQFGVNKLVNQDNDAYNLSKYALTNYITGAPYFFEEISSTFFNADATGTYLINVNDATDTEMPARSNNKTVLWMGAKVYYPLSGYAVFQDKSDPSLKILSAITPSNSAFKMVNDTLSVSDRLYHAERYALLDGDESMLYFSVGNEVWSRNLANGFEQLQHTIPSGEEITFMRHRKASGNPAAYAYNYVMIGTKAGNNYKVRMFTKTSGNLSASPEFVLEGAGEVGDVMYIAPNISENTYLNTY